MNVSRDIDIVYTWVNQDHEHRTHQQKHQPHIRHKRFLPQDAQVSGRFRCNGEIEESIKSVLVFAPWVRNIYVVCADYQSPDFLRPLSPKIHIVHHSTIYGDAMQSHLPTFNSHSIECHLHKIPGLSERFIYSNDDTFLGAPCSPNLFFDGQGRPKCIMSGKQLQARHPGRSKESYLYARYNLSQVLRKLFPRRKHWPRHAHQMKPLTRSLYEQVWNHPSLRPWLLRTSKTRFRSTGDIWPVGLVLYYGIGQGSVVYGVGKTRYFSIQGKTNLREVFQNIRKNRYHMYCLNDAIQGTNTRFIHAYKRHLKTGLPHTSLFAMSESLEPSFVWTTPSNSTLPLLESPSTTPHILPSTTSMKDTVPRILSPTVSTKGQISNVLPPTVSTKGQISNVLPPTVSTKGQISNVLPPTISTKGQIPHIPSPTTSTKDLDNSTAKNPVPRLIQNERPIRKESNHSSSNPEPDPNDTHTRRSRRLKRPPVKRFLTDKKSTLRRRLRQMKKRTLLRLQIK